MENNDVFFQNPLRHLGQNTEEILPKGGFGAILARAGVGKTSFLIQIALDYLLREINVLHISLNDPVDKVCLWYEEVFRNIASNWDKKQMKENWETLLPRRFIMTFKVEGLPGHPLNDGTSDVRMQSMLTSLYDPDRLRGPKMGGQAVTWAEADEAVGQALDGASSIVLITGANLGPSERKLVQENGRDPTPEDT